MVKRLVSKNDDEIIKSFQDLRMLSDELIEYQIGEEKEKLDSGEYKLIIEQDKLGVLVEMVDAGLDTIWYLLKKIEELEKELDK